MKILDDWGLSGIVKKLLDAVFICGIVVFVFLPYILKQFLILLSGMTGERYWFLLPFLYITGFPALIAVNEMRKIFRTLNRKNPFMMDNVKSLKRIAAASFIISASYIIKTIFFNSIMTVIIAMVFIIAGLFTIILAEVFRQAVVVKEENDLTI